jgi:type IV pilus assembly protein PilA
MITKMRKLSTAGFSLVELMVVVAIIGILAAVAIPNFNKFQRRARVAETKTALGGLFNAQKSFLAEWEDYCTSLASIGYSFDGTPRTQLNTGAAVNAANAGAPTDNCAARYQVEAVAASAATTATATWNTLLGAGGLCENATYMPGCRKPVAGMPQPQDAAATAAAWGVVADAPDTFTAVANTNVGSDTDEEWTMTHQKELVQAVDGVNAN